MAKYPELNGYRPSSCGYEAKIRTRDPKMPYAYSYGETFKSWLEQNENIQFGSFSNDGTVTVYINGKRYSYLTDAVFHNKWKKMIRFSPWKVLNTIKEMIKKGTAREI